MVYKVLSVSTFDFKNESGEQISGGKLICYDDNSPKNEPLVVLTLSCDLSLAQNLLNSIQKYPANVELSGYLNKKATFVVTDAKPL